MQKQDITPLKAETGDEYWEDIPYDELFEFI